MVNILLGAGHAAPALVNPIQGQAAHFDVYRADQVSITSTLFAGGDWHWRLVSFGGFVLVDCGGYTSQVAALSAVDSLRSESHSATVSAPS